MNNRKVLLIITTLLMLNLITGCYKKTEPEKLEYYFEPEVSLIEGTLITRLHYGPPNYGEDEDNDEKEYPFILILDEAINVIAEDTDKVNTSKYEASEIQLVLRGSNYIDIAKQYKDKQIRIEGTLFSAFTGHHHTDVLMVVEKMWEKDDNTVDVLEQLAAQEFFIEEESTDKWDND